MAVEKLGAGNFSIQKTTISRDSTGLESIRVSPVGPNILHSLLGTRFRGLTGDFKIIDGQLHTSAFQIVNVIGEGERGVGFWTTENGIVRRSNTTSMANLRAIMWPGESTSVPKGWVFPTNGKKLKIGVPEKKGFCEFVKVTRDPITNKTKATGYSIAIFDAVMATLPYAVPYEYVPFKMPDRKAASNKDELFQGHVLKYDALVGDFTILASRSLYLDFTLPYTDSGVSMIVPIIDNRSKRAWVFLKPLTWDLWVTSACFFVFIGFVIWTLEHRTNEDFRGPRSHQVGTMFWFSFSTLVFAQSNYSSTSFNFI
ncbi:Glutamate receptor 2.7 [Vitis vinifera]|uniref:Glutamate receptor 2.7 n=1 Tax=Vitis vinifera TaxID=29760 RepID=A0A438D9I0_VITVI|nr:Glutamate receptor 2.7 [Vitis vinifera]